MLTFTPPFQGNSLSDIQKKIKLGKYLKISNKYYKSSITNLISQMLQTDQDKRPTCGTIKKKKKILIKKNYIIFFKYIETILKYWEKCKDEIENKIDDPFLSSKMHIKNIAYKTQKDKPTLPPEIQNPPQNES